MKPLYLYFSDSNLNTQIKLPFDYYIKYGHMGFSFTSGELDIDNKVIFGFGTKEIPNEKDLFEKGYEGLLSNDTYVFRSLTKNNIPIYSLTVYISDEIYKLYKNKVSYEYPVENYGDKKYGYFNCITYPIHLFRPHYLKDGKLIILPDFRGYLCNLMTFYHSM